jgi:hypothetical protein
MILRLTWWELGLAVALFLLAGSELLQLRAARRRGLTTNVSRLVTHGAILTLLVAYAAYTFLGWRRINPETVGSEGSTHNWAYLFLGVLAGLVVSYELVTVIGARAAGRTTDVSRLLSHVVMLVILVVLIDISHRKWELYLELLADTYRESLPPGADH